MSLTVSKDGKSSAFLIILMGMLMKALSNKLHDFKKPVFTVLFSITAFMCMYTRKLSLPVLVVLLLLIVFIVKARTIPKLLMASALLVPVIIGSILVPMLYPAMNVMPGDRASAYVSLTNQIAAVGRFHPESITKEDRTRIKRALVFDIDYMSKNYMPYSMDGSTPFWKDGIAEQVSKNPYSSDVIKVWFSVCSRQPGTCTRAFLSLESGWTALYTHIPGITVKGVQIGSTFDLSPNLLYWTHSPIGPIVAPFGYETEAQKHAVSDLFDEHLSSDNLIPRAMLVITIFLRSAPVIRILFLTPLWSSFIPMALLYWFLSSYIGRRREDDNSVFSMKYLMICVMLLNAAVLFLSGVSVGAGSYWLDTGLDGIASNAFRYAISLIAMIPFAMCSMGISTNTKSHYANPENTGEPDSNSDAAIASEEQSV